MIVEPLAFSAVTAERLFRERVRKGFDFPQPWQTKERTMYLTASFNLQSLTYAELKSLYSTLLKQLTHKLLNRDQANHIAAQILDVQREICMRVSTK